MVSKFGLNVRVENVAVTNKRNVYFERTVQSDGQHEIDMNIIITALQMLFPGDIFKISISTYGG